MLLLLGLLYVTSIPFPFDDISRVGCMSHVIHAGDSNIDQGHRRMVIFISIAGEKDFTLVVQGRDLVQTVCLAVEARTGQLAWQQRVTFSGDPSS